MLDNWLTDQRRQSWTNRLSIPQPHKLDQKCSRLKILQEKTLIFWTSNATKETNFKDIKLVRGQMLGTYFWAVLYLLQIDKYD